MKHGKATGPDNISVELIEALEDFGIGKVTHLLNEIYDTGQIPTDLSKSIFIALPKKPVLIAENKEDLQKLLNIVGEESRKKRLELNSKKTEVMVIRRRQESPKCDIFINEVKLKQTEKFKYLGTIISNNGKTNREISARTAQAKINFQKMKTILTNKHISIETRKRAFQCYIESVLIYGCEAWAMSKQIQNKLEATEMWFLRRLLQIPWTAKKTNE
ncbi:RNA-directed DNA polymerase from mobile element jockey [Plakobranchus ocellatus]|uniref:RNA-directed DNA polymerase from mobile element jockey n=1 Tax=Plakobranchus ocellatus TaxID=259542 RepID=A0AAV4CFF4_9GAST|nr:RNA-directed DNA polymerase from mobile element jockey [Plakobranchus ocellatus]